MAIDAALGRLGNKSGVCTSSTRPTNPFEGQLIYETDTNRTLVYDNAAWLVVADNQVLSIDPANSRVGIGTTSPRTPLEIQGTSSGSVDEVLLLAADGNQVAGSGARLHLSGGNATQRSAYIEGVNTGGATNAHALTFGTSTDSSDPVERMRIDSSGNVGIGTTTPATALEVAGNLTVASSDTNTILEVANDNNALVRVNDSTGTQGANINAKLWFQGSGVNSGMIGYNNTTTGIMQIRNTDGAIQIQTDTADNLQLRTDNTTRVTVDGSGNVGIGTNSPGSMLDVRGGVQTHRILPFTDNTYDLGANVLRWDDVYATNGTIQTSDERDKASVADIDLGLAFVNDLRPVTYTWDDRSGNVGARTHMGFVAQEVATVLGDEASNRAVWIHASAEQTTDPETGEVDEGRDIQGLRYNELMAPMVKAIQELTARIEALEAN